MRKITVYILIPFFISCAKENDDLNFALGMAGKNRPELEHVLEYYSIHPTDSLKLKAAKFLIINMPWHYSYGGKHVEEYRRQIDSMHTSLPIEMRLVLYTVQEGLPKDKSEIKITPDIQTITADFLIQNIDKSFEIWENHYWLRELSFDNFCNYLLPYRLDREPLIHWKDSLPPNIKLEIEDLANTFSDEAKDAYMMYYLLEGSMPELLEKYIYQEVLLPNGQKYVFDCLAASTASAYFFRMCGIPTTVDILPVYANGNNQHSEIAIVDQRSIMEFVPIRQHLPIAKIYRKTYSVNKSQILESHDEYIPEVSAQPFYKDITGKYIKTADVKIQPKIEDNPKYLYLGVFSLGWKSIAHAELVRGKAIFNDVGTGAIYIPFYYKDGKQVFVSNPFYLGSEGSLHYFDPNNDKKQSVVLERKYKLDRHKIWWTKPFVNSRFEAADNIQFTNPSNIHTIKERTYWRKNILHTDSIINARYYRFINDEYPVDLAEIHFFDKDGMEIQGKLIGDNNTITNKDLSNINDNNMLSFCTINSWIGMDFGQKIQLGRIEYLPRNDTNGIYPGMKYELTYFDKGNWNKAGIKVATEYSISFDNVPHNAVLWLRNLTEGKQERIFVYDKGKQYWY